ncbi:MAG: formate dehydrogenase accessory sulfurtransferase FdhD [Armatimonadetes bacterium]|nr:formate dehydrogenase accessory sulfurtransferase FdhD [Armatimonadota bacterium]
MAVNKNQIIIPCGDHCYEGVDAVRVSKSADHPVQELCRLVLEQPVTIAIDGVGSYTIMCTPCDTMALAVGFAFTEGIISGTRDIDLLRRCEDDPSAVRMQLRAVPESLPARNLIVASSCGMCGSWNIDETLASLPKCADTMKVPASTLLDVLGKMKELQKTFDETGAAHAAAVFSQSGRIVAFAEDIGRHNALDKVIGKCLLEELDTEGCGVALSGRVSFEMVVKAAKAGFEIMDAVSAPSSLAVEAAKRSNITLCGFVRGDRATIYSHERRIVGSD